MSDEGETTELLKRREAEEQAREWITRVGLAGFESYYPHQLSGGMRKRVALAQTLINQPKIILMDEPFSALDVQTRTLMENELLSLWSATSASVVFVTYDLQEAIALADRVFVLTSGPATFKAASDSRTAVRQARSRRRILVLTLRVLLLAPRGRHAG